MLSLILLGRLMNRGNTDMTLEMPPATMPLMCLMCGDMEYNEMQAYSAEMDILRMNDHVTPLDADRSLDFKIEMHGNEVERLSFQLRSLQDERLIEESQIFDYARAADTVSGSVTLKDLMKDRTEYSLCFLLQTSGGKLLRYYTRVIPMSSHSLWSKLDYAFYFHNTTFDKAKAKTELPTYLESNKHGDNSSFTYVDIHSSAEQVSWGSLDVERAIKARAKVREIDEDSAQIVLEYTVKIKEGDREAYCFAEEFYRMRLGKERIYLLEFTRRMEEAFDPDNYVIAGNKIQLGIVPETIEKKESDDGHILAFSNCGRLMSYDSSGNRLAYIFGFYRKDLNDRRETCRLHNIRIFNVDDTGDVIFGVWGYMNCGNHEGTMGIAVYHYDSMLNTVEEMLYVPYAGGYDLLKQDMNRLCFAGENKLYILKDADLLEIDLHDRHIRKMADDLPADALITSPDGTTVAWGDGRDIYSSDKISIMNLKNGLLSEINAQSGEKVRPITFFESDLVYGVARERDITLDENGHTLFPMYMLSIRGETGRILKEYRQDGTYITDVEQLGEMINLRRMTYDENGMLIPLPDDQILDNNTGSSDKNTLESAVTETYETIRRLVLRSEVDTGSMQLMEPKLVIYEGDRLVTTENDTKVEGYDLFAGGRLSERCIYCYDAVAKAFDAGGAVRDARGTAIYRRTTLPAKNQIMAISGSVIEAGTEPEDLRNACLETWFAYEGCEYKGTMEMPGRKILDLSGVPMDAVLYYVANEEPVFAELKDGSAMLIVGYNEYNVVVMNPAAKEQVYKIGRGDATKLFMQSGNRFMSSVAVGD